MELKSDMQIANRNLDTIEMEIFEKLGRSNNKKCLIVFYFLVAPKYLVWLDPDLLP